MSSVPNRLDEASVASGSRLKRLSLVSKPARGSDGPADEGISPRRVRVGGGLRSSISYSPAAEKFRAGIEVEGSGTGFGVLKEGKGKDMVVEEGLMADGLDKEGRRSMDRSKAMTLSEEYVLYCICGVILEADFKIDMQSC
jgi:hypothetical protein